MKNARLYRCLLYFLAVFLVGCCDAANRSVAYPATQTSKTVISSTPFPIINTPIGTTTPLVDKLVPTTPPDKAYVQLQDILKSNAGCRLPCWWGITPGKTSWKDASHFLDAFTTIDQDEMNQKNPVRDYAYVYIRLPLLPKQGTLVHDYIVKDNTVIEISAFVYDWSPFLYLNNVLTEYGLPDEIFVRTFRSSDNIYYESQPYEVILFYGNLGVLMEYSGGNLKRDGENLQNCFENLYSPFIYIWSSDTPMTSSEVIDRYLDIVNLPYPLDLEKATGMNVISFYEAFTKTGNTICLETPLALWPDY